MNSAKTASLALLVVALILQLFVLGVSSLSSSTSPKVSGRASSASSNFHSEPPIRRVAIIGAGIAGLSLAHAIENTCDGDVAVTIFDSRPAPLDFSAGAGVQLNGGASVLKRINPNLHDKVIRAATPLSNIRARAKPWIESETGKSPFSTLLEINLEETIKRAGGDTEKALIVDGKVQAFTIMRGALQKILFNELPSRTRRHLGKSLVNIKVADDSSGVLCFFDDNTSYGPFDMVCGCDGIQSAVKEYVNSGKISASKKNRKSSSIYSGVRIRFALEDSGESLETFGSSELRQYFGDGAYGLYGTYGAGEGESIKKAAYLVFQDNDYFGPIKKNNADSTIRAVSENVDWKEAHRTDIKEESIARMESAGVPDFQLRPVIEQSDTFFEVGVYFHNPFSFRGWKREVKGLKGTYCVLCGDSAHAMPPFLGQGANQAIQDAYCLTSKIVEHNANCGGAVTARNEATGKEVDCRTIKDLLQEYENVRWFPTASITIKSIFLGYLETGGKGVPSKFRDSLFFVLGKLGIAEKVFLDSATPNV